MSTLIDLFILLSLVVGALVIASAALFGVMMLVALIWDLLVDEDEWPYDWDEPFNINEGEL